MSMLKFRTTVGNSRQESQTGGQRKSIYNFDRHSEHVAVIERTKKETYKIRRNKETLQSPMRVGAQITAVGAAGLSMTKAY